jgi:hypothetical protein
MRLRPQRRNLVVWSSSAIVAGGFASRGRARAARIRRIRWRLRVIALLAVIGVRRLARTSRTRWEPVSLSAGALLMVTGFLLSAAGAFFAGLLVLIVALLKGIASNGRSVIQSADCWRWRC